MQNCHTDELDFTVGAWHDRELRPIVQGLIPERKSVAGRDLHVPAVQTEDGNIASHVSVRGHSWRAWFSQEERNCG